MSINIQTQQAINIDNQEFNFDKGNETIFATTKQLSELFDTTRQNVELHIKKIFKTGELYENSVCKDYLLTASDGKTYQIKHYNLDMIIAVGYRVNSGKATDFRIKATKILKEYLITGEVIKKQETNPHQLPEDYIEALEALVISKKSEAKLFIENQEKQKVIEHHETTIDKITNEKDLYGLREVAKKIQINERVLTGKLYQMGWIYTLANKQTASSKACSGGYMKNVNVFSKTNDKYYIQAQITEKGLNYLIKN